MHHKLGKLQMRCTACENHAQPTDDFLMTSDDNRNDMKCERYHG